MEERWPKCLQGLGTIEIPEDSQSISAELIRNILAFLRSSAWKLKDRVAGVLAAPDQLASHLGYRREYLDRQIFDVDGNRRPNSSENYVPTDLGEYVGPGVAFLPNIDPFNNRNQLVWSQIIPFPNRTTLTDDLPIIKRKATEIRKHYNSYNELADARRHLRQEDVKACVRSAASAVDAILRYYCSQWDVPFPKKKVAFDEKIEKILVSAGKLSYKSAAPKDLQKLLYLYRARNAMHEGDCYYKDKSGNVIEVKSVNQCSALVDAVERFVIWIDSIV